MTTILIERWAAGAASFVAIWCALYIAWHVVAAQRRLNRGFLILAFCLAQGCAACSAVSFGEGATVDLPYPAP